MNDAIILSSEFGASRPLETAPPRFLSIHEVCERTSLSRSTIYLKVNSGEFPSPIPLSQCRSAWLESDINDWIMAMATRGRENRVFGQSDAGDHDGA